MSIKKLCSLGVSRANSVFKWPKKLQFLRGYFAIIGGCIVHLTLGSVYTFGNLVPYLISYIRQRSHPTDLHAGTGVWIYVLALGGHGLSMFLGGLLERKIGPRLSTMIGCGIMDLGVFLSFVTIKVSFWLLLLSYGLLFGLGLGIAYVGPLACAIRWMPRWKGVMAGLVLSGFGLGALVFDPIQTVFINPENRESDGDGYFTHDDVLDRVPTIFLILGGIYVVLQVMGTLLIVNPPECADESLQNDGSDSGSTKEESIVSRASNFFQRASDPSYTSDHQVATNLLDSPEHDSSRNSTASSPTNESCDSPSPVDEESRLLSRDLNMQHQQAAPKKKSRRSGNRSPLSEKMKTFSRVSDLEGSTSSTLSVRSQNVVADLTPSQMLRKFNFYFLWIMMLMAGFSVFSIATLYKFFGMTFIHDDHFLAVVGSASSICNCAGRIVWGLIADKVSYKFSLVLQSGVMCIFILTFYASCVAGKHMFFIWVCVIFFCIGGIYSLYPTTIARSFGAQYMSVNYGLLFTSQFISSIVAALLFSTLHHVLNWVGIIYLVGDVCLTGFVLTLLFPSKRYVILDLGGQ